MFNMNIHACNNVFRQKKDKYNRSTLKYPESASEQVQQATK